MGRIQFPKAKIFVGAVALVSLDANYLSRGGAAAQIWLAGAAASHSSVSALRVNGTGRDGQPARWSTTVHSGARAEELDVDVSRRRRLTWGCGEPTEWRETETGSWRLTADTVEICGPHQINEPEVRLTVRARHLILNNAALVISGDGYVDVRAEDLVLIQSSRLESRAPRSEAPPFAAVANLSVSAQTVNGNGSLAVEAFGADYGTD